MSITEKFEALPKLLKVFLVLLLPVSVLYRIAKYTETKNTVTLVVAIVSLLVLPVSIVALIIDVIFEIKDNKIGLLAD